MPLEVTGQLTYHRWQQKAMKIKGLWLTSRSSDYHMQSWRNSKPSSGKEQSCGNNWDPITLCCHLPNKVSLPTNDREIKTKGEKNNFRFRCWMKINSSWKWTMGTPVQRLTCRSPRDIRSLSHRQEDQDAGRSIRGGNYKPYETVWLGALHAAGNYLKFIQTLQSAEKQPFEKTFFCCFWRKSCWFVN